MTVRLSVTLALFTFSLTLAGQQPLRLQTHKFGYSCYGGRFIVREGGRVHYCFDKVHYMEQKGKPSNVPADIKEYFRQEALANAERSAKLDAEMADLRERTAPLRDRMNARRRAQGMEPALEPPQRDLAGSQAGPRAQATQPPVVAYSAPAASDAPPPQPTPIRTVPLESLRDIAVGQSRQDVVAKLGQPAGRMSGLANGGESWSYRLSEGPVAKIKFEEGIVTEVVLPR